jgi:hypothetical protein
MKILEVRGRNGVRRSKEDKEAMDKQLNHKAWPKCLGQIDINTKYLFANSNLHSNTRNTGIKSLRKKKAL